MNVKCYFLPTAILLLCLKFGWASAQSFSNPRPVPAEDLTTVLRQLRTGLNDVKHEMRNHESEINLFEKRLQSQEAAFEHFRQQLLEGVQADRDFVRASNVNLDGKTATLDQSLRNLEGLVRGVTEDLRQIKTQANDSVSVLGQYKQKLSELENLLQAQSEHMQHLDAALQSMMEVWQAKETVREMSNRAVNAGQTYNVGQTYKVQSGDTLEKIARVQKVSVQALQEANQLSSDRIIIGQTLKIP